ncbi:MAG: hypothetical protein Q8Q89_00770 [bacterium]|nr:hypothetical protein [bacterium]
MKYRVLSSRWDIPRHGIGEFEEDSDEKAKARFDREFKKNPNYAWDWLTLIQYEEKIVEMWQKR